MKPANLMTLSLWIGAFALAAWALKEINLDAIIWQVKQLSFSQWCIWLLLNIFVTLFSTLRWHLLLSALSSSVSLWRLLVIRLAGQTISFITPGPQFGGEPLQVYWLYKRCAIPLHRAIISLGLDRCFELWVNFSVLLIGALYLLLSPTMAFAQWGQIALVLCVLAFAMPAVLFYFLRSPNKLLDRIKTLSRRWLTHPKLTTREESWQQLEADFLRLNSHHRGALLQALSISIVGWGIILGELYFLLHLLDIYLPVQSFVLIAVSIRLAMLLPLPGGIGTIEAALLWCFQMLELQTSDAFALIALMRLRDLTILAAGFASLRTVRSFQA